VRHFIQKHNRQLAREIQGISNEALEYMGAYDWPGNVRELENTIERAMTLEMSDLIRPERLPEKLRGRPPATMQRFLLSTFAKASTWKPI